MIGVDPTLRGDAEQQLFLSLSLSLSLLDALIESEIEIRKLS